LVIYSRGSGLRSRKGNPSKQKKRGDGRGALLALLYRLLVFISRGRIPYPTKGGRRKERTEYEAFPRGKESSLTWKNEKRKKEGSILLTYEKSPSPFGVPVSKPSFSWTEKRKYCHFILPWIKEARNLSEIRITRFLSKPDAL